VPLTAGDGLDTEAGRAVRLGADTAAALGVGLGAVVELVNPHGAPLRAWVADVGGPVRGAAVAPIGLRMLNVGSGIEVEIRAVHSGVLG
jgi:hypothetical protein